LIQLVAGKLVARCWIKFCERVTARETNETIDDIRRKNFAATPTSTNAEQSESRRGVTTMLKPSFRFFIIPLGAVATLASLSAQNTAPRAQRDSGSMFVREQVVDCSNKNPSEVCVIPVDRQTNH
jgi:hypothetical protein